MIKWLMTYCLVVAISAFGQSDKFQEGNDAYKMKDYEAAIEAYSFVVSEGDHSAALYYNLGNAHFRNDELGKAIWAYESALKIEPDHEDALFNLEFSIAQTEEKLTSQRQGFGHWLQGSLFSSSINLWSFTAIGASFIFAVLIIIFLSTKKRRTKNLSLISGALVGLILIFSVVIGYLHKDQITSRSEGVVISEQVDILVSPTKNSKVTFKLSEGAKVKLVSEDKDWVQIELNNNKGWLPKKDIWEI